MFVTHDQEEALEVADRVVVMDKGKIEQIGTPRDVYERPATAFVHEFIGESIVIPVTVENAVVHHEGRAIDIAAPGIDDGPARLFMRPYNVGIVDPESAPLQGTVRRMHGIGPARRVEVALAESNETVELDVPRTVELAAGQLIGLAPLHYRIFPGAGSSAEKPRPA